MTWKIQQLLPSGSRRNKIAVVVMVSPGGKVVVEAAEVRIGEVETEELANPRVQDIHRR